MTAGPGAAASPSPHPDLDTLADLDAGGLEGAEADRVRAHLAGCPRCEQAMAALEGVRADLAAAPARPAAAPRPRGAGAGGRPGGPPPPPPGPRPRRGAGGGRAGPPGPR